MVEGGGKRKKWRERIKTGGRKDMKGGEKSDGERGREGKESAEVRENENTDANKKRLKRRENEMEEFGRTRERGKDGGKYFGRQKEERSCSP